MGKFTIYESGNESRYRLKANNGETIISGEGYSSKQGCQKGIASVKKNATDENRYEMKDSKDGKYYFNLKAANGEVIGVSETYNSAGARKTGMQSVMNNAPDAEIVEE